MIALADEIPLLSTEEGDAIQIDLRWLNQSLLEAAAAAGYENWWQAESIARSILDFLRMDFEEPSLPVPRLETSVKEVLRNIGFPEIAETFRFLPPPARIFLNEIAREAGEGFELAFFQLLSSRIRDVRTAGAVQIDCEGLRDCVKFLRRAKNWRRDCAGLQYEIVHFVRAQVAAAEAERAVSLQLS